MGIADFFTDMQSLFTVISFATFVGIVVWAFGRGRRDQFAEAAQLPFADEEQDNIQAGQAGAHHG